MGVFRCFQLGILKLFVNCGHADELDFDWRPVTGGFVAHWLTTWKTS